MDFANSYCYNNTVIIIPAIDLMIAASESNNTGGTYTVTTSSTAATGYTNVSTTAIFVLRFSFK